MKRGALPVDAWPEFAKAPWRQSDSVIVISRAERRALGCYFDTLLRNDLPLETTDRSVILRHLRRIRCEHTTIPAVYANISYLVGVLARIYPHHDWRWLHDWRLDWRRKIWRIKEKSRHNTKLPFRPENSRRWPRDLRETWKTNWPAQWPVWRDRLYRPAYGLFRGYCAHGGMEPTPTREALAAYVGMLVAHEGERAPTEVGKLYCALSVLFPETSWAWLQQQKHELEGRLRPRRPRSPADDSPRFSVPFRCWPTDDQKVWLHAISCSARSGSRFVHYRQHHTTENFGTQSQSSPGRYCRPPRPPHQWSPATIQCAERAYASYLKTVQNLCLADRFATESGVAAWIEEMRQRGAAPLTLVAGVNGLHAAMRILHPERDWRWLQSDVSILADAASPARDKLARIVDVAAIRKAAIGRMRRAEETPPTVKSALSFQDGIIMLLLSYRPVRRRNLAATRLNVNLIFDEEFKTGRLYYEHTKTGGPYDTPLPRSVLHPLQKFLSTYRPLLVGPGITNQAWLSSDGRPLSAHVLCQRIGKATHQELGIRITPHLFRDCLATTVSEISPENIEDAARLLGHSWPAPRRRHHSNTPPIELYRQRAGTTATALRLSELQHQYRARPRPRARR